MMLVVLLLLLFLSIALLFKMGLVDFKQRWEK